MAKNTSQNDCKPSVNPVFSCCFYVLTFARFINISRMTRMTIEGFLPIYDDWKASGFS